MCVCVDRSEGVYVCVLTGLRVCVCVDSVRSTRYVMRGCVDGKVVCEMCVRDLKFKVRMGGCSLPYSNHVLFVRSNSFPTSLHRTSLEHSLSDSLVEYTYTVSVKKQPVYFLCFSPGTPFMARLATCLEFYVHERMNSNPAWQGIKVQGLCGLGVLPWTVWSWEC